MRVITEKYNGVIHNIYPDGLEIPEHMMNPNIGGWNKKCRHVYEYVGTKICPDCRQDTHEIDYELQSRLFKEYYKSSESLKYKCQVEGGTIRGWWSI